MNKIMTIYEVRRDIVAIEEVLTIVNAHILDNSLDSQDLSDLRKCWEICRNLRSSKWTYQVL